MRALRGEGQRAMRRDARFDRVRPGARDESAGPLASTAIGQSGLGIGRATVYRGPKAINAALT